MIFLVLLFAGALAGLAMRATGVVAPSAADAAHRGMAGAFLAGGIAVGVMPGPVSFLDPLCLAVGVAGAVGFALLLELPAGGRSGRAGNVLAMVLPHAGAGRIRELRAHAQGDGPDAGRRLGPHHLRQP